MRYSNGWSPPPPPPTPLLPPKASPHAHVIVLLSIVTYRRGLRADLQLGRLGLCARTSTGSPTDGSHDTHHSVFPYPPTRAPYAGVQRKERALAAVASGSVSLTSAEIGPPVPVARQGDLGLYSDVRV